MLFLKKKEEQIETEELGVDIESESKSKQYNTT